MKTRTVAMLVFPGALALDVTGPAEVFAMANKSGEDIDLHYELQLLSIEGGLVRTASGVELQTQRATTARAIDTLIVSGGTGASVIAEDPTLVSWIQGAAAEARRVCSVCTGVFLLAAAGLLDGRRVVTHWGSGSLFRAKYPNVKLDLEPIYIRDGSIWTSAGVTAGIDLALALVSEDLGRSAAIKIAKELVVFLHRPGGQAQFSSALSAQATAASGDAAQKFVDLHAWISENLNADLSVTALAARVNMAPRSFARLYSQAMETTPAKAIEDLRLEAAKRSLESGAVSVKAVAYQCGFGNEERMRRSFTRKYNVAPSSYREHFGESESNTVGV